MSRMTNIGFKLSIRTQNSEIINTRHQPALIYCTLSGFLTTGKHNKQYVRATILYDNCSNKTALSVGFMALQPLRYLVHLIGGITFYCNLPIKKNYEKEKLSLTTQTTQPQTRNSI